MAVALTQVITEDRASGAQVIDGSLRFDNNYLTRTPSSEGNLKSWTWSAWVKPDRVSGNLQNIFEAKSDGVNYDAIYFRSGQTLSYELYRSSQQALKTTTRVFRDTGWYHLVVVYDAQNSTADDRVRIYVNGERETSFSSSTNPDTTDNSFVNDNSIVHQIGDGQAGNQEYDGRLSQVYLIDGQSLDASYFGFTDPLTNTWRPKKYTGTYGTNGFYLPMDGNSPIGEDKSGNGNDWTPVNFGGSNTIEKATGAFPILNTDGGGKTARPGTRTDANASNLVLALPLVSDANDISNRINSGSTTKTVTNSGVAFLSTQSNFYGISGEFGTSGDRLSVASSSDFAFGTGDFTIEGWIYPTNADTANKSIFSTNWGASGSILITYDHSTNKGFNLYDHTSSAGSPILSTPGVFEPNKWYHIAVVRNSGTTKIYIDGIEHASASHTTNLTRDVFVVGAVYTTGTETWDGYIQDVRVYKGVAKYTSNFIPASTDPDILPDTPSGVAGGSALTKITDGAVVFDGADGTALQLSNHSDIQLGSGTNWTIEFFAYRTGGFVDYDVIAGKGASGTYEWFIEGFADGSVDILYSADGSTTWTGQHEIMSNMALNRWYHIALVRNGSGANNFKAYVDGIQTLQTTAFDIYAGTGVLHIGGYNGAAAQDPPIIISNFRIVNGSSVYTSNFTPPTAPLTNVTNTTLLCCQDTTGFITGGQPILNTNSTGSTVTSGTRGEFWPNSLVLALPLNGSNGGTTFTDQSAVIKGSGSAKTITATGDVKTSTLQSKFYGSSALFDQSGDGLITNSSSDFTFGIGALTLECWFWRTNVTHGYEALLADNLYGSAGGWSLYTYQDEVRLAISGASVLAVDGVVTAQTWTHLALQRGVSNDWTLYINGVSVGTATNSTNLTDTYLLVGANNFGGNYPNYSYNGHIQDVRVYKGVTKYTSNFTVTAPSVEPISAVTPGSIVARRNAAATNFNPFTTDINAVRGQESAYATLNPLNTSAIPVSNGNLSVDQSSSVGWHTLLGTHYVRSGKWYAEMTIDRLGWIFFGIDQTQLNTRATHIGAQSGTKGAGIVYNTGSRGDISYNGANSVYTGGPNPTAANGDVLSIALDLDNNNVKFYKNNILQYNLSNILESGAYYAFGVSPYSSVAVTVNFGQKPFKYAPPEGFKTLCLANLPRPTEAAVRPDKYFKTVLWTGDGNDNRSITGVGFQPSLTWIKTRSVDDNHVLHDEVRGANRQLFTNTNDDEFTSTTLLKSFDSDGFTLGTDSAVNGLNRTLVAWCWKAGGAAVSNTDGSITSQVSANQDAGFSIVSYTGTGSAGTVGHGLGKQPKFMLVKNRSVVSSFLVYHNYIGGTGGFNFNSTGTNWTDSSPWNDTNPTSSVINIGTNYQSNGLSNDMIAYCWSEIPGFSKFGSYSGNNNADGVYVDCGFRPALIWIRSTSSSRNFLIDDSTRNPYNGKVNTSTFSTNYATLAANLNSAEPQSGAGSFEGNYIDILSNGFKLRSSAGNSNGSETYIYAAWAEAPTNNLFGGQANAR